MNPVYEKLCACYESIRARIPFTPEIALVLGSGLGNYASKMEVVEQIPYGDIAGFPVSTAPGHVGQFVFGYVEGVPIVAMQGRVHYYEGYDMTDVVLPIRLMKMMGAEILFLTNAAGGIRQGFSAGDLMMITGQIATFVPSPLRRKPKIEVTENAFKITIPNRNISNASDEETEDQKESVEQEKRVMKLAKENGSVSRKEIEGVLGISQSTGGRLLKKMVAAGQIVQIGKGKNTHYVLQN